MKLHVLVKAVNVAMRSLIQAVKTLRRNVKTKAKKRLIFAKEANSAKDAFVVYVTGLFIQDFDLSAEAADVVCVAVLSPAFNPPVVGA